MSKSQERVDEGLVEILDDFLKGKIHTVLDAELAIQSYLKKEGYKKVKEIIIVDSAQLLRQKPWIEIPKGTKIAILD